MGTGTSRGARTIYVTTAGPEGVAVRDMVAAWASAGIVKGSLWVTPDDLVSQASGPPMVEATEIERNEQRRVDLFNSLGKHSLASVRVIVVHLLTLGGSADLGVAATGRTLVEAVRAALPRRAGDEEGAQTTRLRLINILVPVSGATHATEALLMPGWDMNIVVSPEDRPNLDRSTVFVRHPGNFIGHAAAAICGLGGLLEGMEEGALDHLELDSTTHDEDVVLARFTVRSVVGEDIVETLAEHTFNLSAFGPDGPASLLPGVRVAADPVGVAQRAAEHVLSTDPWRGDQPFAERQPVASSRRFQRAVTHATAFNVRMFGVMSRWLLESLRFSVEQRATRIIVGEDSGIDVRIGAGPAEGIAEAAEQHLAAVDAYAKHALRAPDQQLLHLSPAAWTLMREMATALVDGSELPAAFPEPRTSGRRELLPPSAVVPALEDVWTGVDDREVQVLDVKAAFEYADYLQNTLDAENAKLEELEVAAIGIEEKASKDREQLARLEDEIDDSTSAKGEPSDGASDAPRGSKNGRAVTRLKAALARYEKQLKKSADEQAKVQAQIDRLENEQTAFDAWVRGKSSYMRTLVNELVERRTALEKEESAATQEEAKAPPRERLVKRQKVVRVAWVATVVAAAAGIGLIALVGVSNADPVLSIVQRGAIALGIALILLVIANHGFYRAIQAYEWALAQLIARRRAASERAIWRRAQMARLDAQATAMSDWGRILGEILHRPWGRPSRQSHELTDEVVAKLPAAMAVAGLSQLTELPFQSIASAARSVYVQGWLSRAFANVATSFDDVEIDGDSGFSSIDADTTDRPSGPRRRFLEYLANPQSRSAATESAMRRFRSSVDSREIPIPTRTVRRRGPFSNELDVDEPNYFEAAAGESIAFASDAFSATGLQRLAHYVARSAVWLPGSVNLSASSSSMKVKKAHGANAVRVDLSKRLTPSDLVLFGSAAPSEGAAEAEEARRQGPGDAEQVWR